jgi:hypothetical protein
MKRTALILILLAALVLRTAAHAQDGIIFGDGIPSGTVVNHDVLLIGNDVSIDGIVNGNAFILGNQVLISGTVNGSLVMLAQNAAVGGDVTGAVYAAALTLVDSKTTGAGVSILTYRPAKMLPRGMSQPT